MSKSIKILLGITLALAFGMGVLYLVLAEDLTLLKVGDKAPDFLLKNQYGQTVSLSDYAGKKNVVLFFYPKDETPGCTKEACTFRDNYEILQELGAEVIGINNDNTSSHKSFADKNNLSYQLVSDEEGITRKAYGVNAIYFFLPERTSFVIGKDGMIKHIYQGNENPEQHVKEALSALKELS